jgi:hypothetical protein
MSEKAERPRPSRVAAGGVMGRVSSWLREYF